MATKVKIRTRYDYAMRPKTPLMFNPDDPKSRSLTNQSDKDSADINLIMKRYEKTGLITDLISGNPRQPHYGDFTDVGDFFEIQNRIAYVKNAFDALPAELRSKFGNDPSALVDFLADPKNDADAITLGLKQAMPVENPKPAPAPVAESSTPNPDKPAVSSTGKPTPTEG